MRACQRRVRTARAFLGERVCWARGSRWGGGMCGRVCGRTRVQRVTSGGVVVFRGEAHAHRRIIVDPLTRARWGHKHVKGRHARAGRCASLARGGVTRVRTHVKGRRARAGRCSSLARALCTTRAVQAKPLSQAPPPVRPRTSPLNGVMFHEPSFAVSAAPGGCKRTMHVIARMALDAASPASPLDFGEAAQRGKLGQSTLRSGANSGKHAACVYLNSKL